MHIRQRALQFCLALAVGLGTIPGSLAAPSNNTGRATAPARSGTTRAPKPTVPGKTPLRRLARPDSAAFGALPSGRSSGIAGLLAGNSADLLVFERLMERRVTTTVRGIRFVTGELAGEPVVAAACAGGKLNAALVTTALIEKFQPAEIVLTGTAGALKAALAPGDLLVAERTAFFDIGLLGPDGLQPQSPLDSSGDELPMHFTADRRMLAAAAAVARELSATRSKASVPRIVRGLLVSGDSFIASTRHRDEIAARTGGEAVDSDAAAVAQICAQERLPLLIVRGISHRAGEQAVEEHRRNRSVVAGNCARYVAAVLQRLKASRVTSSPNR